VEQTLDQRIVEAAAVLPTYGGVTGWASLAWCGGRWFDGTGWGGLSVQLPVWLATSVADIRGQPGISVSAEGLDPRDLMVVDGLPTTTLVRAVCFEMRYAPNARLAAVTLDMAAYSDLVSIDEVRSYAATLNGRTGIPRCREGIELADENAWSPQEVLMRGVWIIDAGLSRPLCNRPVFDLSGRLIGTPDLIDPVAGVAGEYDGSLHLQGAQRSRDVQRESEFRRVGLEYVTMLSGDNHDPRPFIKRLREAYARAARTPHAARAWTIETPRWWIDTTTVRARRALSASERQRLLRHRAA
jgi:hypothetical protein